MGGGVAIDGDGEKHGSLIKHALGERFTAFGITHGEVHVPTTRFRVRKRHGEE